MAKVSVIIPVYNVELYIEECLNSVINQTLKDIEIICIDDCGQDNSMKIVEDFAKKDNRIKIIKHKINQGLGEARNTGIKNATGEYIAFLDSDDFVDLNYYEILYNTAKENNSDIVYNQNIIEYKETNSNKQFEKYEYKNGFIVIDNDNLTNIFSTVWSKIYKTSFIKQNNILFPPLIHEDEYFNIVSLSYLKQFYVINNPSYYYRQRANSIMKNKVYTNYDMIKIIKLIYNNFKSRNIVNNFKLPLSRLFWHLKNHTNKEEFYNQIKSFLRDIKNDFYKTKYLYNVNEVRFVESILNSKNYFNYLNTTKVILLFGCLLLLTIKNNLDNTKYYITLFNFIPLLKIIKYANKTKYKLFNIIPLITIKNK